MLLVVEGAVCSAARGSARADVAVCRRRGGHVRRLQQGRERGARTAAGRVRAGLAVLDRVTLVELREVDSVHNRRTGGIERR